MAERFSPGIILEYMDAGSLTDIIAYMPRILDDDETAYIIHEIAQGILDLSKYVSKLCLD